MHLRMPSIDKGVQAFVWALVFFLFMWLGALLLDVSGRDVVRHLARRRGRDLPARPHARQRRAASPLGRREEACLVEALAFGSPPSVSAV